MGFFASELKTALSARLALWDVLKRMGVHPNQIDRLIKAADDFALVAKLPSPTIQQLRQELNLNPIEYARLQAGVEADNLLRLMVYHNYPIEEVANKTNAVFASALKDRLATGGKSESVYPALPNMAAARAVVPPPRRRGPAKKNLPPGNGSVAVALPVEAEHA